MKISQETIDAISASELATQTAGKAGVKAILALLADYNIRPAKYGDAKVLSDLLKTAGVKTAACKRYAELTVMVSATIHHRATMARSKVKAADKAETEKESVLADMEKLEGMTDMQKVRQWSKENGPKAKAKAMTEKTDNKAEKAEKAEPIQNVEAVGQLREIREVLAMINSGQSTQAEALSAIAEIIGFAIATPATPAKQARRNKTAA